MHSIAKSKSLILLFDIDDELIVHNVIANDVIWVMGELTLTLRLSALWHSLTSFIVYRFLINSAHIEKLEWNSLMDFENSFGKRLWKIFEENSF